MITWDDLRAVAVVGTERRAFTSNHSDAAGLETVPASSEVRALELAALFGAARRAGWTPSRLASDHGAISPHDSGPVADGPSGDAPERFAPPSAVQFLDLALAGGLGTALDINPIVGVWMDQARHQHMVVPHRLLVPLLERVSNDVTLFELARAVIGERGRWLATRNKKWGWAIGRTGDEGQTDQMVTDEEFAALSHRHQVGTLRHLRNIDPDRGRHLMISVWGNLSAGERHDLMECMEIGLSTSDEDQLEAGLDDRSRRVKALSVRLLDGLVDSQRSHRCQQRLAALVQLEGGSRKRLLVNYPDQPQDRFETRDFVPVSAHSDRSTTVEAQWLQTLIAGTPLAWWESELGANPAQIVALASRAVPAPVASDLISGWTRAALAERSLHWALALIPLASAPDQVPLIELAGQDLDPKMVKAILENLDEPMPAVEVIRSLARPWEPETASAVMSWIKGSKSPVWVLNAVASPVLLAWPVGRIDPIERWLDQIPQNTNQDTTTVSLTPSLKRLYKLLATRQSIIEAFL